MRGEVRPAVIYPTVQSTAPTTAPTPQVAILCNHQRSIPKTHGASMEKLEAKLDGGRAWTDWSTPLLSKPL
jgi:hypothetical protein